MILPELLVCAIASSIAIRILTLSFVRPVSDVWEKLGGGQADVYYPDFFEGCWQVGSTLVAVETPKGIEYTNDAESMLRIGFRCLFFVARKEAAPA